MRLIDADAFYEELEKLKRHADNEFAGAIALTQVRIAIRPTVDAEPVVRCKDCVNNKGTLRVLGRNVVECEFFDNVRPPNGYCDQGERKDNG